MTKVKELKVLNIAQPNAHKVFHKGKNVENREMYSKYRGTVAIYASKTFNKNRFEDQASHEVNKEECSFGYILGLVDIVDCIDESKVTKTTKEWFVGTYGYVLENVVLYKKPIEVSPPNGAIVWWNLTGEKLDECLMQAPNAIITPLSHVEAFIKTDSKAKFNPSTGLAAIVGSKPLTLKSALNKVVLYADENGLIEVDDDEVCLIVTDEVLKKIFGKKEISPADLHVLIEKHLEKVEV